MTTKSLRCRRVNLHVSLLVGGLAVLPGAIADRADAAACGGATLCSCGDTVTADRTLVPGTDPVTTVACPADGLRVDPGVTLGLGGATLSGTFLGLPIGVILDAGSTLSGPGTITGFNRGVIGITFADGITVSGVTAEGSFDAGFDFFSDMNSLSGNTAVDNGQNGFLVIGSDNSVTNNVARENGAAGLFVSGLNMTVKGNRAELNDGIGISVTGNLDPAAADNITSNKVKGPDPGPTAGPGMQVVGSGHGINGNTVERYEVGFRIDGPMRKVSSNTAQDCGVGFEFPGDDTLVVNGNRAFRNTAGDGIGYRIGGNGNFFKGNRSGSRNKGNKVGFEILGDENRFESNRAEYNAGSGTGYEVSGIDNTFKNDRARDNGGDGFHLTSTASGNSFENTRSQANVENGYFVEGTKNAFHKDRAIGNGEIGFVLADVGAGDGNTLTETQASRNVICQYDIGANNVDGGNNRANGVRFSFDAAGGEFCPPNTGGGGSSGPRPPQAAIRYTVDRGACAATCPVSLDGSRSSGMIAAYTFSVAVKATGAEVIPPVAMAEPALDVDLAPGEYVVTLTVGGPTGADTEKRSITVRP
jgi:parallel beta-helix repeat protein